MKNASTYLFYGVPVALAIIVGFLFYKNSAPSPKDAFAQCLTEQGVTMFGAWWCPHCSAQKARFGNAFKFVEYVECSPNGSKTLSDECRAEGIKGFPTWRFADGSEIPGEAELSTLASKTSCELSSE